MLFKDKIIAAFKLKYPGINLSKTRLAAIAAKVEAEVIDDETKIDATLATMDKFFSFAEIAKEDDEMRTLEAKTKGTKEPSADPKKEEVKTEDPVIDADTPAWAKTLNENFKQVSERLKAMEGEKTANSIRAKAAEKLRDIPEVFWAKRVLPEKEEDLEAFVTEVTEDFGSLTQEGTNNKLKAIEKPKAGAGGGAAGDVKEATKDEVASVVESIM